MRTITQHDYYNDAQWITEVNNRVFIGHTPKEVYSKYQKAAKIVGKYNILVVSPDLKVFTERLSEPRCDPMIFALVAKFSLWFRVACWDLDKDLKQMS